MRKEELNMEELDQIAGGNAYINHNTNKMCFDSFDDVYVLKNCTADQASELCRSFIGKYATVKEYDTACRDALIAKGWI